MQMSPELLKDVFGPESSGDTPESRARTSRKLFVRSLDGLAEYSNGATGRRFTALEALNAWGIELLIEVMREGVAVLSSGANTAGAALKDRREALGLEPATVAARSGLSIAEIHALERGAERDIRRYERAAMALGLDERFIAVSPDARGDSELAVRLRTLRNEIPQLSRTVVSAIAEAAWVATTQHRLERTLGISVRAAEFEIDENYERGNDRPWRQGYRLAEYVRETLKLGKAKPIDSMRALCEDTLGIPVIQANLGEWIAGLTVETGEARAIVCNDGSRNSQVFVRRTTLAHELAHLLFDPVSELKRLRVDQFDDLDRDALQINDRVEQRANAFAVEFLAPRHAMKELWSKKATNPSAAIAEISNHFGISSTAARYHLWNALDKQVPLDRMKMGRVEPEQKWIAAERFTADFHPLHIMSPARIGRFSASVVRAASEGIVSWDTAAQYLGVELEDARSAVDAMRELFPAVFEPGRHES